MTGPYLFWEASLSETGAMGKTIQEEEDGITIDRKQGLGRLDVCLDKFLWKKDGLKS